MLKKLLFAALVAFTGVAHAELSENGVLLDRIVAVVNEGVVLQSELEQQLETVRRGLSAQNVALPPEPILRAQVLESLIMKRIQLQRAERLGMIISDDDLNHSLATIAERNGLTLSQLPGALASQGIDYAMYREEARAEMTIEQLRMRDVAPQITVSRGELERVLAQGGDNQQYRLNHLLISAPADAPADEVAAAEQKARELVERLRAGTDFGPIAIAHSDVPGVLENRGDLGWRGADELPSLFAEQVVGMVAGATADPVRSASGFHVIQLAEVRGADRVVTNQRRARHILIQPDAVTTEAQARAKIEEIAQRLAAGEDFAALAEAESDDGGTARRGGDLGWNDRGSFVAEFEQKLDTLEPSEVSEPFRTEYGWHIVQLLETREQDTTEEARRNEAAGMLRARKFEEETQKWLRQLRDEAYVEIRLDAANS